MMIEDRPGIIARSFRLFAPRANHVIPPFRGAVGEKAGSG